MNILVDLGHPGHVHFFRNPVAMWRAKGHVVFLTRRDIPIVERLGQCYGMQAERFGRRRPGAVGLALELACRTISLARLIHRHDIHVCAAIGGALTAPAARLTGRPCVVFDDTDTAGIENRLSHPLATAVATPAGYPRDLGAKQIRYNGLHELSYLHPSRFTPDREAAARCGVDPDAPYAVVRFCSWQAGHDIAAKTASLAEKIDLMQRLTQNAGTVRIVPEGDTPAELRHLAAPIPPEDFHHMLAFARLCVTEGATTASEAAILGVPSLYINPIRPFYILEQAQSGLIELGTPSQNLPEKLEILARRFPDQAAARQAAARRAAGSEDVAAFVADLVERTVVGYL